jgi:hypothetical protein
MVFLWILVEASENQDQPPDLFLLNMKTLRNTKLPRLADPQT